MSLFSIARNQSYHSHFPKQALAQDGEDQSEAMNNPKQAQQSGDVANSIEANKDDDVNHENKNNSGNSSSTSIRGSKHKSNSNQQHHRQRSPKSKYKLKSTKSNGTQRTTVPGGRPKHASLLELLYGIILYCTCIFLPSTPRYLYQLYAWTSSYMTMLRERLLWSIYICWRFSLVVLERWGYMDDPYRTSSTNHRDGSGTMKEDMDTDNTMGASNDNDTPGIRRFGRRIGQYISSTSTASLWEEFNQQSREAADNDNPLSSSSAGFTWGYGRSTSAFPAILMVLQDLQILLLLAIALAFLRIWFVHMLVPEFLASPRRLEAMTRCKSSHLLSSSSYRFGDVRGWDRAAERTMGGSGSSGMGLLSSSGTHSNTSLGQSRRRMSRGSLMRQEVEESEEEGQSRVGGWYDRTLMWCSYHWFRLRPSVRRALGHEPSARYNDIIDNNTNNGNTTQHQQHLYQSPSSSPFRRSNSIVNPTQQLFTAPRHATATFRLLYTSLSCIAALVLFRSAEFWPRTVFGTHPEAHTRHCWDLSGSFSALGFLDDDYDAKNGKLKYFFLAQAAYQLHSLCFHVVSMLLLLLYGGEKKQNGSGISSGAAVDSGAASSKDSRTGSWMGRLVSFFRRSGGRSNQQQQQDLVQQRSDNPFQQQQQQKQRAKARRLISMKTSMQSYVRPMTEHVIVLALLVGAYLFSGLRRLGAVGIFTLELSSVFLQLLQVCIYAPESSWWRKPEVVLFVHRMLTVPTFVYCRLIVLPFVLWRSALFESQEWLEQIAKVFSPTWSESIYRMFNVSLCLIFALNLVLFRRLLFHPHLKQIVKQKGS